MIPINRIFSLSKNLSSQCNVKKDVNGSFLIRVYEYFTGNVSSKRAFNYCTLKSEVTIKARLEGSVPYIISTRNTGFFNRSTAEELWKGVTGVSSAGRKRGRAKGNRRKMAKNLNRGQQIGCGEENIAFPGLNAPLMTGKSLHRLEPLPKDENRMKKLIEIRDNMGKFRPLRLNPLERGWTGNNAGGRHIGPPDPVGEDTFDGFDTIVLESKMVKKMTGNLGQKRRVSLLSVTGNQKGCAGFFLAKGNTMDIAQRRSKNGAVKNLMYIELCEGHTVFHDFYCEFMFTKIFVKKKPEGYGLKCHRVIRAICEVLGIKNLHAKIDGAMNPQSITKAFFLGLLNQKTYQQIADEKQLCLLKTRSGTLHQVLAVPSNGHIRSNSEIRMDEELDFNTYAMGGKVEIERKKFVPFYQYLPSWETHLKKVLKSRNHEKIKRQLELEYGSVRSFLSEKYPECVANYRPEKEEE